MDRWLPALTWRDAVREITGIAGQQTFQPQSGSASIQVMGLLESAGVPLDAAWIANYIAESPNRRTVLTALQEFYRWADQGNLIAKNPLFATRE